MREAKPKTKNQPGIAAQGKQLVERAMKAVIGLAVQFGYGRKLLANNLNLGIKHLKAGNYDDAAMRFKMVTWIDPKHVQAWYMIGNSRFVLGERPQAIAAFKKVLELEPQHAEAAYMLALARGPKVPPAELPKKIPQSMVISHFNELAPVYDQAHIETYGYRGHELIAGALEPNLTKGRSDYEILDMGAGTGLCAIALRPVAFEITGVDISEEMIKLAMKRTGEKQKKLYDALIRRDIHEFLNDTRDASYDIVIAAGLISYVGEVKDLFAQVSRVLKNGGLFAFTADMLPEGEAGFRLNTQEARFGFSESYLKSIAAFAGLSELKLEKAPIYPDYPMWLGVLRKNP